MEEERETFCLYFDFTLREKTEKLLCGYEASFKVTRLSNKEFEKRLHLIDSFKPVKTQLRSGVDIESFLKVKQGH